MDDVTGLLRSSAELILLWQTVIALIAVYLVGLGLLILWKPEKARAFLGGFASNLMVNTFEAVMRALAGLAMMGVSPDSRFPLILFVTGAFLVFSAIPMLLLPGMHRRFAKWAVPFALRIMPVYGIASFMLAGGLVWAVFA